MALARKRNGLYNKKSLRKRQVGDQDIELPTIDIKAYADDENEVQMYDNTGFEDLLDAFEGHEGYAEVRSHLNLKQKKEKAKLILENQRNGLKIKLFLFRYKDEPDIYLRFEKKAGSGLKYARTVQKVKDFLEERNIIVL